MATYYRGNIILNNKLIFNKILFKTNTSYIERECMEIKNSNVNTTAYEKYILSLCIFKSRLKKAGISQEKINEALKKFDEILSNIIIRNIKYSKVEESIIYEKVFDKDKNTYAREINTGIIFPLLNAQDLDIFADYNTKGEYSNIHYEITLEIKTKKRENYDLIGCYCMEEEILDYNQIYRYQSSFNNKPRKNKQIRNKIQSLSNKNIPNSEIILKTDFKKQSSETRLMENIEYLLLILKDIDESLYYNYEKRYKQILYSNNQNLVNPSFDSLKIMEKSIELDIATNAENIINYLDSLIYNYLNNVNDIETITLDRLDYINKLFLEQKNNYSIHTQRSILKKMALVYLLKTKYNIENITIEDLENSYFSEHIKTIIMIIKTLVDEKIIELDSEINLKGKFDIQSAFEIIKNIKFNNIQNDNVELVKKLRGW